MSPEYAVNGVFSTRSDVFSFGVIVLEIISGKKNSSFHDSDQYINLLAYVSNRPQLFRCKYFLFRDMTYFLELIS